MPNRPPSIPAPQIRSPLVHTERDFDLGLVTNEWATWFEFAYRRMGGREGRPIIGDVAVFEKTIDQAGLAGAGQVIVLDALPSEQWRVRDVLLSGDGTNFSGGGNRLLALTDGSATWTLIPAATLQSLSPGRWGDTGAPFPTTTAHMMQSSAAGADIVAEYSGGTTDYTAGSLTLAITAERMA